MEEARELGRYLPQSFKSKTENDYMQFLWDAFESNYSSEKYEFASLAFHLLYMSFVSFSIWQIKLAREQDFKNALVGFQNEAENKLMAADSPFRFYDQLKESQIFRFLKLIGCQNEQVGEFARFIKRRNKIADPSGTVFFNDKLGIDDEINEMLKEVANIQSHMQPIITEIYQRFLLDSADPEERQYSYPMEEIIANLIHRNYMSLEDIKMCLFFDLSALKENAFYDDIMELHKAIESEYGVEL